MLSQIDDSIQLIPPEPQFFPGIGIDVNIISIEHDRYISRPAIERMRGGQNIFDIEPNDLLQPVVIEHQRHIEADVIQFPDRAEPEQAPATEPAEAPSTEQLIDAYVEVVNEMEPEPTDPGPLKDIRYSSQ